MKLYVTSQVQTKPLQVECEKGTREANCNAPSELALLKTKGFCVVRIVSVFFSNHAPFTGEELRQNILGRWKPDEVTVVLDRWTYYFYIPTSKKNHKIIVVQALNGLGGRYFM